MSTSLCHDVFSFCFEYVWRFNNGFSFKTFMDACEIENFEGRILVAGDSLSLSVFRL